MLLSESHLDDSFGAFLLDFAVAIWVGNFGRISVAVRSRRASLGSYLDCLF